MTRRASLGKQNRHERARHDIIEASWELARRKGLSSFSLKDVATAVGVQAPSLYSYFSSKNAIYDEMFAAGNRAFLQRMRAVPRHGRPRETLFAAAHAFVEFCVEDPVRHQLLFQRTIPAFEPSAAAYAIARDAFAFLGESFAALGITNADHIDIWTALLSGLAAQQLANEPDGQRWTALIGTAVDMFATFVFEERS